MRVAYQYRTVKASADRAFPGAATAGIAFDMAEPGINYLTHSRARGDWVRLRTLLVLRWIAIAGQTAAVLIAETVMGFELPLALCALLISASASVNIGAYFTLPAETRLSEPWTLASLFFDLAQLVLLLMATGGLNNPFAVLILAPVTISATALTLRSTLFLGLSAVLMISVMSSTYLPLVDAGGNALEVPQLYRGGIAAALGIAVIFLSLYARRVAVEGYAMSQALIATQIALASEQRMAAIGGLAAAAAHELGTPLATIKLVAGELRRELAESPELAEDAALIHREAARCAKILTDLSRSGHDDKHLRTAPIGAVVEEAAAPHRDRGKRIVIRVDGRDVEAGGDQLDVPRTPELVHGLRNVIQNAVDFAQSTVWIDIEQRPKTVRIAVGDDGPGFGTDILPRLGEPYVSTRPRGRRPRPEGGHEGMGLGLFITKTLLRRTGARVSFANGSDSPVAAARAGAAGSVARPTGAIIEMIWDREALVTPRQQARRALGPNEPFSAQP